MSICAIFKDEAPYLQEWIEFHRLLGVEKFYLYNNNSRDNFAEILQHYCDSQLVRLHDCPVSPGQMTAYFHCLKNYRQESRWIAFIDLDEFLFPTEADCLPAILHEYEKFAGVLVNWLMFGSSGHVTKPEGLVIANYTKRANPDFPANRLFKTIVNPVEAIRALNPHLFYFRNDLKAVTENKIPFHGELTPDLSVSKLRINHYFLKSREEFKKKVERGRADIKKSRKIDEFDSNDRNEIEDLTISLFIPALKSKIIAENSIGNAGSTFSVMSRSPY